MNKEIIELILSAQINFENLVAINPILGKHPMFAIAKMQLDEAVTKLKELK